ncbi:hypothetical protein IDJ77_08295 [Mucilaginibacter sp. ZT4R22]|uniref:DUF6443 domain-containing protein n=1 Tax=Mucilaginibacter pankratovii TaxID=2772110 RepID=A0ABR7WNB6_9SPHI|nr:DUF6443 domain-containing protein [Mucilaginibacter pankratovii]MBD1363809.1 hypothetical protein [Mucilaginibacter pankratovii]
MKLKIYVLVNLAAMFCLTRYASAQQGFIQQDNIKVSGIITDAQTYPLTTTQKQTTRSYIDGLGRAIQTLGVQASPGGNDMIQPFAYDNLGRQTKSYLPYAGLSGDVKGSFRTNALSTAQPNFYNQTSQYLIAKDGSPFTQQVFEDSPLQRLLKSGTVGDGFQAVGGTGTQYYKTVSYRHNLSATDGNIRLWNNDGTYTTGSVYTDNLLTVVDGIDEDGKETLTFTDMAGKTILKRQKLGATNLDTYYIYNAAGMLSYTVPPKAIELLNANSSYTLATAPLSTLVFKFVYDGRGRIIAKTIPSKGTSYIVYDPLNRPVLTQDANMAASNKWAYIKYDVKGRPVSSGIYQDNTTSPTSHIGQVNMQTYVNTLTSSYNTAWYESRTSTLTNNGYYTSNIFPTTTWGTLTALSFNYYDDYDMNFDSSHADDFSYANQSLTGEIGATTAKIKGAPTITCKATIGAAFTTPKWLTTVVFYDKRGNPIQVQSNNHVYYTDMNTVTDTKTTVPDFTGVPQVSKVTKRTAASTYVSTYTTLTYDHMYRLKTVGQGYGTTASTPTASPVAAYTYNELGQAIKKGLGYLTASTWLQNLDMRYNIRGQLLTINNSTLTNDSGVTNGETTDVFGMEMLYDKVDAGLTNTASFNGKLTGVKWMSKDGALANSRERGYKYTYDQLNRYKSAIYGERTTAGTGTFTANANAFDEVVTSYDLAGNIMGLTRNSGTMGGSTYTAIDNLTYSYDTNSPNKLLSVSDATGNALGVPTGGNTYLYDTNGNLTKDLNKTISQIDYNILNRTDKISFSTPSGRYINYTYDASGQLIRKQQYNSSALVKTTDYVDGFVYEDNNLLYFPMPEGRVRVLSGVFTQEFVVTDQQGNARISFQNNSGAVQVKQENSYYGFGMAMLTSPVSSPGVTANKRLYNGGSEWQNDYTNLPDYYQTFYRNYDAALGRWVAVDPVAESQEDMSPYQYAGNNPIMYNDPLGDLLPQPGSKEIPNWENMPNYYNGPHQSVFHSYANDAGYPAAGDDNWIHDGGYFGGSNYSASWNAALIGYGGYVNSAGQVVFYNNPIYNSMLERNAISESLDYTPNYNALARNGNNTDSERTDFGGYSVANPAGLTHAQELAKYGQITWGYNFSVGASLGPVGGTWEVGTIVTDKGWARDYRTTYYAPGLASLSVSHTFLMIKSIDAKNLPTFSDWNGLSKGAFAGTTLKGRTSLAYGGGLGSNYAVTFAGLAWGPNITNFMKDSKTGGGLAVGITVWLGPAYRLPNTIYSNSYYYEISGL